MAETTRDQHGNAVFTNRIAGFPWWGWILGFLLLFCAIWLVADVTETGPDVVADPDGQPWIEAAEVEPAAEP